MCKHDRSKARTLLSPNLGNVAPNMGLIETRESKYFSDSGVVQKGRLEKGEMHREKVPR